LYIQFVDTFPKYISSVSRMKLHVALMGLLLATTAEAFSPKQLVTKMAEMTNDVTSNPGLWRAPMNMVAGGAERAQRDEYYEGT
jgi:hypothetical protein